jgi:hypothetical protein
MAVLQVSMMQRSSRYAAGSYLHMPLAISEVTCRFDSSGNEGCFRVKILLRNAKTGLYYGERGWVQSVDEARDFRLSIEAMKFALRKNLSNVVVDHVFPEARQFDFVIPVDSPGRSADRRR